MTQSEGDSKIWSKCDEKQKLERQNFWLQVKHAKLSSDPLQAWRWMNREGRNLDRKKFLAVGEACMAIFRPIPGFKGKTFVSSGFSTNRTLISASALPYWLMSDIQEYLVSAKLSDHKWSVKALSSDMHEDFSQRLGVRQSFTRAETRRHAQAKSIVILRCI